jgi:uncharacterized membrane protein YhiD involved in acid resistance
VFVFIALVVGMAVGSQRYMTAIVGTLGLLLVVIYLNLTSFGTHGRYDGYLTCRLARAEEDRQEVLTRLRRFCRVFRQISSRQSGEDEGAELVYQVGLRDRERGGDLLDELRRLQGVRHVSLVMRSELSEV